MNLYLKTSRVILREFRYSDLDSVHNYASDIEVVRYMEWGPNSIKETEEFIEQAIKSKDVNPRKQFELAVTKEKQLIGSCGLVITNLEAKQAYIGYCFNKKYWGMGFATESANKLLDFGFSELSLHRIHATCDVNNTGSERVLQKIGMKKEGCLREHKLIRKEWRDSYLCYETRNFTVSWTSFSPVNNEKE